MSNRKRKPSPAHHYLAANDGAVIHLKACCRLDVTISATGIKVAHDDGCPAIRPASPGYVAARIQANSAVAAALTERGIPTLAVIA